MIFQLFHPAGEPGALYLVALLRHAVIATAMSCKTPIYSTPGSRAHHFEQEGLYN